MEDFNTWINQMELIDIHISNRRYTWSNNRRDPTLVRLDRILVNVSWSQSFIGTECKAISAPTSDHTPLLVDTRSIQQKTNIFHYENHWCNNEELAQITRDRITRGTRGMATATRINHGLRLVRAATRAWLKQRASDTTCLTNNMHLKEFLDAVEEWRRLTDGEFRLRQLCAQKIKTLTMQNSQKWKRRANIKWCNLGDENTRFFHTMATYIFRKNKIKCLKNGDSKIFDDTHKLQLATEFYSDFFAEQRTWTPNINLGMLYHTPTTDLTSLIQPFSWAEIEKAIKQAPNNRSPGPDGFTSEFYRKYADDLKAELCALFNDLHRGAVDLKGMNLAYITLLQAPMQLSDYRPVSLQHSIPKLIAKVLTNRLQPKISSLLDPMQPGFVIGRSIAENFATAMEMVQCAHRNKQPFFVLKLDFQKAFDTIHGKHSYTH